MILLVEDEKRFVELYVLELQLSGFEVSLHSAVDEALRFFTDHSDRIELVILDIMMSPGTSFTAEETDDGTRTGILIFEKIREQAPRLPFLIFTNINDDDMTELFHRDEHCRLFHKSDLLPHELAEEVRLILSTPGSQGDA